MLKAVYPPLKLCFAGGGGGGEGYKNGEIRGQLEFVFYVETDVSPLLECCCFV